MKRHLWIQTGISFAVLFNYCIPKKNTSKEYIELAEEYKLKKEIKKSERALNRAIRLDPQSINLYVHLAEVIQQGSGPSAKTEKRVFDAYNEALGLCHWCPVVLISRAKFFESSRRYKMAERDLDTLLRKQPGNVEAYLLKAKLHFYKTDTSGFNILDLAYSQLKEPGDLAKITEAKATKELSLKMWKRSIDSYMLQQSLSPKYEKTTYCPLSWAYLNLGKKDSACFYYRLCDRTASDTVTDYTLLKISCH